MRVAQDTGVRGGRPVAYLFWTGEVILRNQKYELLFYVPLDTQTGNPVGNPQAVPLDPVMPRSSLSIAGVDGVGNWLFYVAAPSGRSQMFAIASEGDLFGGWRREQRVPLSPVVRSVESVSANIYRVAANPDANNRNFIYLADVYFIGTVGDRNESEVLMQRFYVNPRNGNLLTLSDNRADRSLGVCRSGSCPWSPMRSPRKTPIRMCGARATSTGRSSSAAGTASPTRPMSTSKSMADRFC